MRGVLIPPIPQNGANHEGRVTVAGLENLSADSDLRIDATSTITFSDLQSNSLRLPHSLGQRVSFSVSGTALDSSESNAVGISQLGTNDTLSVGGAALLFEVSDSAETANALIEMSGTIEQSTPAPSPSNPSNGNGDISVTYEATSMTRQIVIVFCFITLQLTGIKAMATSELPEHYAESVMIFALSADGADEISLRLARFPDKGTATIWLHIATVDGAWSLAHEAFELLHQEATSVRDETATFGARLDAQQVNFTSTDRNAVHMQGHVKASLNANPTRHPELEAGRVPVSLDLSFNGGSQGFRSETNRWELTGEVTGTITVAGKTYAFNHAGKWHEQTGPRARFAPAFTYFNVQGEHLALLAIGFVDRVNGYVLAGGEMLGVQAFTIDPPGPAPRAFRLTTSRGEIIEGSVTTVQEWSVPIEGKRRPGAAVLVDSNRGLLLGSLNDWQPD